MILSNISKRRKKKKKNFSILKFNIIEGEIINGKKREPSRRK